jgi:hypothetical protein
MKEEFVSYTQALALKELGFDEECFGYYDEGGNLYTEMVEVLKAPLYQQAFRWFREKHGLEHEILYDLGNDLTNKVYLYSIYVTDNRSEEYKTYEEAEQACLDKLIEIVKKR